MTLSTFSSVAESSNLSIKDHLIPTSFFILSKVCPFIVKIPSAYLCHSVNIDS
ncbi:hypothetical protein ACFLY2_00860 [Patescibacteria group bacterium]